LNELSVAGPFLYLASINAEISVRLNHSRLKYFSALCGGGQKEKKADAGSTFFFKLPNKV
jgi:hypothetical protein